MSRWRMWTIAALVACGSPPADTADTSTVTTPVPKPTGTPPGSTGETGTPAALRPPVQQSPPNAEGQTPAFAGQTRAPQPAGATAFDVQTVATGLDHPWGFEELPDGRFLVTQRPGDMVVVTAEGAVSAPLGGLPAVDARGQGGLLDVALAPDFATSRRVYWTFSEARGGSTNGTSVARGTLSNDESGLVDVEVIFQQLPAWNSTLHFGSRLVFAPDGNLFVTFGERSVPDARVHAQDPTDHLGTVVRLTPDGGAPADNPFVGDAGGDDRVWSYGHRNLQAATLDLQGRLWTVEHGPRGGDELNRPQAGKNHGWPIVTYGEDYDGSPIGAGITAQAGMEQPVYYWDPVIAPSGMAVYDGDRFAGWRGDLLVGGLQAQAVVRLTLRNDRVYTEEWLPIGARVRDVKVGRDGAIYVATDETDGRILRLVPGPR